MSFCPKTAPAFNSRPISDNHAAAWCRRQYKAKSEQCQRCELRHKYGVGLEPAPKTKATCQPVQMRLF